MSSLDRWIAPYVREDSAATIATSATMLKTLRETAVFPVASPARQAATPGVALAIVANRRAVPATEKHQQSQSVNTNVAGVANVAAISSEWTTADWQEFRDERIGHIADGDDSKLAQAEQQAFRECISRWLARHPDPHVDPDMCPQCGEPSGVTATLPSTPFLNPGGWPLAIHDACVPAWCERRRREAVVALAEIGLKGQAT